jgi:hypothetical protein
MHDRRILCLHKLLGLMIQINSWFVDYTEVTMRAGNALHETIAHKFVLTPEMADGASVR